MSIGQKRALLRERADKLQQQGRYDEAIIPATELVELERAISGSDSFDYALSIQNLAFLCKKVDKFKAAEPLYHQALDIYRRTVGEQSLDYATTLNNLALLYTSTSEYPTAKAHFRQALQILSVTVGQESHYYARTLKSFAGLYDDLGDYRTAAMLYRSARDILRETLGEDHPLYVDTLDALGWVYHHMGNYKAALPLHRQSLNIKRESLGEQHSSYATSLNNLATLYHDMGDYKAAEPLYREARDIYRETLGERHPLYAASVNNLAGLCRDLGDYKAAEQLYREALNVYRQAVGEQHLDYAHSLINLAELYHNLGNFTVAFSLYRKALNIFRETVGERHPSYAAGLKSLAGLYHDLGDYKAAEPLYREARDIIRETLGERHPSYARVLNYLAILYRDVGDYKAAEQLYREARDIIRETLGERHPDYVKSLNSLASRYRDVGDYKAAEQLYREACDICRETFGEHHEDYAGSLSSLAGFYHSLDDFRAAEPIYRKACDIYRETLGKRHPLYAASVNNLAGLYLDKGDYKAAEQLYREARDIIRETLGERHPKYAASLENFALLLAETDRMDRAFEVMKQAGSIHDHLIGQVFSMGSESQRMAHLENMRGFLHVFLSLARQECLQSESTTRSAMGFVLRRKAIGAEALAAQRDAVLGGNYPALRERLEQFRMLTYEITRETLAGPGAKEIDEYQQDLNTLNIKKEQLEAELARQIPEMDLEQQLRTADYRAIAHHLPNDTALVEFIRFYQYNFTTVPAVNRIYWSPPHYLAFVLHARAQDSVIMIDLGNADLIDHMVVDFRASITHRGQMRGEDASDEEVLAGAAPEGTELRAAVFDLLVTHLDGSTRVIFAPDGELTRLPFEVLPTDDGRRLIDTYHFSYLSIGRDALRFGYKAMHDPTAPVVIANPDYNLGSSDSLAEGDENTSVQGLRDEVRSPVTSPASADIASANGPPFITAELSERHSRDLPKAIKRIDRLPNVEAEGREIGKLLNVDPWLRENALEGLLKATKSPRILHIATHGFFIENQRIATPTRVQASGFADHILSRISASGIENPLLRSGLVLAGVNTFLAGGLLSQDAEDGVLTALDVSSLDLLSTDLAVLSACETGLGDVQTGEGVFGLRRAFMLAGAKTLVMSLWKVPDEATKELMVDFYRRVLAGEGRADALRKAQLAIKAKHPDPYYWGAFICQGDPSPLPDASGKHT